MLRFCSNKYLIFIIWLLLSISPIQAQDYAWGFTVTSGGNQFDGHGICVDQQGNVFAVGRGGGSDSSLINSFQPSAFIQKMDHQGNVLWAKTWGDGSTVRPRRVKVDHAGFVYIAGIFYSSVDLDPGPGQSNHLSQGQKDVFLLKMDASNGEFIWAQTFGGCKDQVAEDMTISSDGHIYLAGTFRDTVDFDPGPGVELHSPPAIPPAIGLDSYVSKFDLDGNYVFAKIFTGMGYEEIKGIASDDLGNIYLTGRFAGTSDFDPSSSDYLLTSYGISGDIHVTKLDVNGQLQWVRQIGSFSSDEAVTIDVSADGYIVTAGKITGTVDMDPGPGVYNLTSWGGISRYVQKLDPNGNFVWAGAFGGIYPGAIQTLRMDQHQNVYLAGNFMDTFDFDPGPDSVYVTTSTYETGFLLKLNDDGEFDWVQQFEGAGITMHDLDVSTTGNIVLTGSFSDSIDLDPGPNSVLHDTVGWEDLFAIKLHQCQPVTEQLTVTECDSVEINNQWYTANGTYTQYFVSSQNCDSILELDISLNHSVATSETASFCSGESYAFQDTIYHTAGVYSQSYQTTTGCDSVHTLHLSVQPLPHIGVSQLGDTLMADSVNLQYQWLDCDNGFFPLPSETFSFLTDTTGQFAVEVFNGSCVDTSACYLLEQESGQTGLATADFIPDLKLFPNPARERATLQLQLLRTTSFQLEMHDAFGRLIQPAQQFSDVPPGSHQFPINRPTADGMYWITVTDDHRRYSLPVLFLSE